MTRPEPVYQEEVTVGHFTEEDRCRIRAVSAFCRLYEHVLSKALGDPPEPFGNFSKEDSDEG